MNESIFNKPVNNPESNEKEELKASVIENISEEQFKELVQLDKTIFPGMDVEESELRESFESEGVQVILRDEKEKILGYLTSLPHNEAIEFLLEDDPDLVSEVASLYIESIGILPEHRSLKNILAMWQIFQSKAKEKGYKKVTGHFRVSQGLSDVVQKRLGADFFRRMENWSDFGEPFDYLELDLK